LKNIKVYSKLIVKFKGKYKSMHYNKKTLIYTIKNDYPIEMEIEYKNLSIKFFAKENKQHLFNCWIFLKLRTVCNLFRSDNIENSTEFIKHFNSRDIAFQIGNLKTLETI